MLLNSFEQYLAEPNTLNFNQMQSLHSALLSEISDDPDAMELYNELIDVSTKYAEIRARWFSMTREEQMDIDSLRTAHHDSVIIHFNMLARYLRAQGKKASWRDQLGDEEKNKYSRKTIGDFCCYIVFINSICAR